MNFKIPIVGSIIAFVLLFIVNLIAGNAFGIVLLRTFISTAIVFGLLTAMIVVFKSVLGVDTSDFTSNEEDGNSGVGTQFDMTVGDDGADGETDTNDYGGDDAGEESYSEQETDYDGGGVSSDADTGSSFYDDGFSDVGTSSSGNMTGDTIKDKLGYDATTEDLAKAIRTIMPKDD